MRSIAGSGPALCDERRNGPRRRHFNPSLRWITFTVAFATLATPPESPVWRQAHGETVSGGTQVSVWTPTTYGSLTITGTNSSGTRSTLSSYAPLQVTNDLTVTLGGVLYREAAVNVSGAVTASAGGTISSNGGLLAAPRIVLDGFSATNGWSSTIGDFVTGDLTLSGGSRLGDLPATFITNGGVLTVDESSFLSMDPSAFGVASLSQLRLRGGEFYDRGKISASTVVIEGGGGDISTIGGIIECIATDGTIILSGNTSLPHLNTTRSQVVRNGPANLTAADWLVSDSIQTLYGGDVIGALAVDRSTVSSAVSTSGTIALDHFTISGSDAQLTLYAEVDTVVAGKDFPISYVNQGATAIIGKLNAPAAAVSVEGGSFYAGSNSQDSPSTLGTLSVSGPASTVSIQNTDIGSLGLASGAAMILQPGSHVTGSVSISGGSRLSLGADLLVNGSITISGVNSELRHDLSRVSANTLYVQGATTFASSEGDVFRTVNLSDGAGFVASGNMAFDMLSASAGASVFRNDQTLTVGYLTLEGMEWSSKPGDSVTGRLDLRSTDFTLGSDLTVPELVVWGAPSTITSNGHAFTANSLTLGYGAVFQVTPGEVISDSVAFYGPSNQLVASTPLSVRSIQFSDGSDGSTLMLSGFTGPSVGGAWGLRLSGNVVSELADRVAAGKIAAPQAAGPLTVFYDVTSDRTLVTVANPFAQQAIPAGRSLSAISYTGERDGLSTTASFAAGTAGDAGNIVTMLFLSPSAGLHSQAVDLQGTNGVSQVLQMTYDDGGLSLLEQESLFLLWLRQSDGQWVNSVLGNTGTNPGYTGVAWLGSWADYTASHPGATVDNSLGAFGVDIVTHTVWAAINHNSQFGVGPAAVSSVPEIDPAGMGSVLALVMGALGLLERRRLKAA